MATTKKSKTPAVAVTPEEVIEYLKIKGQYAAAEQEVRNRKRTAQAAKDAGIKVTGKELQKAADGFRALMDLNKARDTERWLKTNGLNVDAFENYLETNILKSKFMDRLEKNSTKYQKAKPVRQAIREMAYRDWLAGQR